LLTANPAIFGERQRTNNTLFNQESPPVNSFDEVYKPNTGEQKTRKEGAFLQVFLFYALHKGMECSYCLVRFSTIKYY
jgi:hypothetical protein